MANQIFHGGINAPSVNGITPAQAAKLAALADALNVSGNLVCFLGDVFAPSFQPPNTWTDTDFTYTTAGSEVTITGLTATGKEKLALFNNVMTIPATIGGNSVTTLASNAFANTALTTVTIPASITAALGAFTDCPLLTVYFTGTLEQLCAINTDDEKGYFFPFSSAGTNTQLYVGGTPITALSVPSGVAKVGNAFQFVSGITSAVLPDSVTSFRGFYWCPNLTTVTLGNGITVVPLLAFYYNTSLTNITFGTGVTTIEGSAFKGCTALTSISLPSTITLIDVFAFEGCTSLTSFNFAGTKAQWKAITLGTGWNNDCPFTEVVCSDGTVSV